MKIEQFDKAIELKREWDALERAKKIIADTKKHRLSYIEQGETSYGCRCWSVVCVSDIHILGNILDRHDSQIRKEIEDRINEIQKEIEDL